MGAAPTDRYVVTRRVIADREDLGEGHGKLIATEGQIVTGPQARDRGIPEDALEAAGAGRRTVHLSAGDAGDDQGDEGPPAESENKPVHVAYAKSLGIDTTDMTKAQVIDAYTSQE